MATNFWYNGAAVLLDKGELDLDGTTLNVILSNDTHVPVKDDLFVNESGTTDALAGETDASGYVGGAGGAGRLALTSNTVVADTSSTRNRAKFDATADLTWDPLGGGTNDTIMFLTVFKNVDSDDELSPVILTLDINSSTGLATNSGAFTVAFNADGIGYSDQGDD